MKKKLHATISGPMSIVACRLPDNIIAYLDRTAARELRTKSDIMRVLVIECLRSQGVVATADEMDAETEVAA